MKKPLLFIFLILFISACDDGLKPNQKTEVNGKVFDKVKNNYLANAKVVLVSCKKNAFGVSCADPIDSTRTDKDGNFNFNFTTKGGDLGYKVEIAETENHTKDRSQPLSVPLEPGKANEVIVPAREFNYLILSLQLRENARPPLIVISGNTVKRVEGVNNNTTLLLRVLPQTKNKLIFSATDLLTGRYRRRIDTLDIDSKDTTRYNVILRIPEFELR